MVYLIISVLLLVIEVVFWALWNKQAIYKVDIAKTVILPCLYVTLITVFSEWSLGCFLGFLAIAILLFFLTLFMQFKND